MKEYRFAQKHHMSDTYFACFPQLRILEGRRWLDKEIEAQPARHRAARRAKWAHRWAALTALFKGRNG